MEDSKLVDSVALTLIARGAIIIATGIGLPTAFWMMNRAVNSVDAISAKIDTLRDQGSETAGTVKMIQQLQASQSRVLDDHEARLRSAENTRTR